MSHRYSKFGSSSSGGESKRRRQPSPTEQRTIANTIMNVVARMNKAALVRWYVKNVGYNIYEDIAEDFRNQGKTVSKAHLITLCRENAAAAMFYSRMPDGVDTPGAEDTEKAMCAAIVAGRKSI